MQASPVLRLPAIDILRGVVAGYVVLFHTALVPSPQIELPPVISPFVRFGGTGVLLFFVLSGFSLSMTMGRHLEARQPLLSYARSRFWRIAPVFYVMLIAAAFQTYVIQEETFWPGRMALNGLFLFNLMPGQQEGMVMASWTIGVEVLYYFAFPLLYRCSAGQKIAIIIVSAVAFEFMLQASSMEKMAYFSVVGFIPIFLFGELGFRLFARWRGRPDRARVGMACLLGGFVHSAELHGGARSGEERGFAVSDRIGLCAAGAWDGTAASRRTGAGYAGLRRAWADQLPALSCPCTGDRGDGGDSAMVSRGSARGRRLCGECEFDHGCVDIFGHLAALGC